MRTLCRIQTFNKHQLIKPTLHALEYMTDAAQNLLFLHSSELSLVLRDDFYTTRGTPVFNKTPKFCYLFFTVHIPCINKMNTMLIPTMYNSILM